MVRFALPYSGYVYHGTQPEFYEGKVAKLELLSSLLKGFMQGRNKIASLCSKGCFEIDDV